MCAYDEDLPPFDSAQRSLRKNMMLNISGRARAFQSMVGGGMDVSAAVSIAGLMVED